MININKILIATLAVIVVLGAVFLLSNNANKSNTNQTTSTPTQTETTTTTAPSADSADAAVTITASGYEPRTMSVKAGTKVVWTNSSGQIGNVSSVPHPTHSTYPPLNLGDFSDGETVSLVFNEPGTYGYHNHLNASQTGTVVVTP